LTFVTDMVYVLCGFLVMSESESFCSIQKVDRCYVDFVAHHMVVGIIDSTENSQRTGAGGKAVKILGRNQPYHTGYCTRPTSSLFSERSQSTVAAT
jgi:hypothetical protein